MTKLIIIFSLITYISCAHICPEDGLFPNPGDVTTYIKCKEGKVIHFRCPESADRISYLIFNGIECVDNIGQPNKMRCPPGQTYDVRTFTCLILEVMEPYRYEWPNMNGKIIEKHVVPSQDVTCPPGTTYDKRRSKCPRKDFAQPFIEDYHTYPTCLRGYTYVPSLAKCRPIIFAYPVRMQNKPRYNYICPTGYIYDTELIKCRTTVYVSPYPLNQRPSYTCPIGFQYIPSLGKCRKITKVHPIKRPFTLNA